jgi:hypothetical protein
MDIHHIDGNKSNNAPGNLEALNRQEHAMHTNKKGVAKIHQNLEQQPNEKWIEIEAGGLSCGHFNLRSNNPCVNTAAKT